MVFWIVMLFLSLFSDDQIGRPVPVNVPAQPEAQNCDQFVFHSDGVNSPAAEEATFTPQAALDANWPEPAKTADISLHVSDHFQFFD
ncbi:hypothetical protein [Paracoccus sp. (in: a-proteobacteria)]|uniref:hypothetical protein n=1 Tax=Paracoccus sp. TaxID=267 RepID=UPI00289FC4F7|nr:hypothetical protein [Paracoccus sp. (in: a-proteobacteria)]